MKLEDKVTISLIKENISSFKPYKENFISLFERIDILKEQEEVKPEIVKKKEDNIVSSFLGTLGQDATEALMRTITGRIMASLGIYPSGFLGRIMTKTLAGLGLKEIKAWYSGDSNVCGNIAKSFSKALKEEITTGEGQMMIKENLQYMLGYSSNGLVSNFIDLQIDRYVTQFINGGTELEKVIEEKLCNINWLGLFRNITRFLTKR